MVNNDQDSGNLIIRMYTTEEIDPDGFFGSFEHIEDEAAAEKIIREVHQDNFAENIVLWVVRINHSRHWVWRRNPNNRAELVCDGYTNNPISAEVPIAFVTHRDSE